MKTQARNLLSCLAIILISCLLLSACAEKQLEELIEQQEEEEKTETAEEPIQPEETVVALPGLPDDVAGYTQWLKLNAEPIPPVPGGDPHNGTKNVYVNKTREDIAPNGEQQFPYPDGSIVVKEANRPGKDYVGLIAIMRKKAGVDPDHNDWEFIEYVRNAPDAEFSVIAKDGVCWGCHARVEDIDYVFTELQ
ncbi:hypothetical protein F4141_12975 [Candidatus Poribacteria bacterium]|nr:hypothetical protein [Candidatus Poribacteria bacterium]MYH81595.1 hypothetical protein [Candidatus Poribacteria bacterium]